MNKYTIKIPECKGIKYVISDIHGCLSTFKTLFEKLNITTNDQLFLLGDYIDRGTDSKGVIDYILEIQQTFQIYPLRGNHEEDFLTINRFNFTKLVKQYKSKNINSLFDDEDEVDEKYLTFLNKLPYFIELENFILVHAGFNFKKYLPYENLDDMIWIRDFEYDTVLAKNKTIIHGHTPYTLDEIKQKIDNKDFILPIDNGCVFNKMEGYGNLLCLNLNTLQLIIQPNIEA